MYRRYRDDGSKGLTHRSAGRPPNRAAAPEQRARALALIREKYSGDTATRFGPTLAVEHLGREDNLVVDHETLRRWMLAADLWSRVRKRSRHRRRRARMAYFGELLQFDGSFHRWFEDRGDPACLLTLVDDATGRSLGRFSAQETIWAAVAVLWAWIAQFGIPRAIYTDWKNVYVRRPNAEEHETGAAPLTQFGRMCALLGIQIIPASSSQAKGRIKRNHGTHQDRLVKKMRRHGIATMEAANAFLDAAYWDEHNQRFAVPAVSTEDFHIAVPRGVRLEQVFRLQETRTVGNDWIVRYHNRLLQRARQSERPPARSTVVVFEDAAGQLEIRYRDRVMRWTEVVAPILTAAATPPSAALLPPPAPPRRRRVPCADHPGGGAARSASATRCSPNSALRCERGLWTLPEPWTRRARAHRSFETTDQFPRAPTGTINEGTISNES